MNQDYEKEFEQFIEQLTRSICSNALKDVSDDFQSKVDANVKSLTANFNALAINLKKTSDSISDSAKKSSIEYSNNVFAAKKQAESGIESIKQTISLSSNQLSLLAQNIDKDFHKVLADIDSSSDNLSDKISELSEEINRCEAACKQLPDAVKQIENNTQICSDGLNEVYNKETELCELISLSFKSSACDFNKKIDSIAQESIAAYKQSIHKITDESIESLKNSIDSLQANFKKNYKETLNDYAKYQQNLLEKFKAECKNSIDSLSFESVKVINDSNEKLDSYQNSLSTFIEKISPSETFENFQNSLSSMNETFVQCKQLVEANKIENKRTSEAVIMQTEGYYNKYSDYARKLKKMIVILFIIQIVITLSVGIVLEVFPNGFEQLIKLL